MPNTKTAPRALAFIDETGPRRRILLVDDSPSVRRLVAKVLEQSGFEVVVASNVNEALKQIASQTGDVLTVVSAMRHSNPKAVTFIFSGYPEMDEAAKAILNQADEVLTKPMSPNLLVKAINDRLKMGVLTTSPRENVSNILEQETQSTIAEWLRRVDAEPEVISVPLTAADRCAHLPALFHDLVERLRQPLPLGTRALLSPASLKHGMLRREQGYTAAMIVEESRMLQVSIFQTLQENLNKVDFSVLLLDVMSIADEVDSQLAQAMSSYISEAIA